MVPEKPPFPSKLPHLSLLVFLLAILDNGVQCFQGKKVLSMHKFQWKQGSGSSSCLSQKPKWCNDMEMKHEDSCSGKIIDWNKRLQKRLIMDNFQLRPLHSRMKNIIYLEILMFQWILKSRLFGGASGLVGLERSDLSLISQASGSLVMGGNPSVYKNTTPISYTRMINNPLLLFYFLNLTGITTSSSIYQALKAEFMKQFSGYPSAPSFMILDSCFNLSGYQEVEIPDIKMYFEGSAELNVDVTGVSILSRMMRLRYYVDAGEDCSFY
ncbi:aspartyl protease family protein [Salix suchowensis]|nr:aspartyl protease family protein [Salix suchowensis]